MKKVSSKFLSLILALSLLISVFPVVSFAGEGDPVAVVTDSNSVRSNGQLVGQTVYVFNKQGDGSNNRVAFYKVDFSAFTDEQIRKIDDVTLNVFATADLPYTGLSVAVLSSDMEDWNGAELVYSQAYNLGMLSTSIPNISEDQTNMLQNIAEYKTLSGLGDAVVEHLMSDTDDKIVCFRLMGIDTSSPTLLTNHLNASTPPTVSVTFSDVGRLPKAPVVDGSSTRGTAYYDNQIMGTTIYTQANSSSNTRYAFYKFDFSDYSVADLYKVKDMTLNLYYNGTSPYTGVKVAVLPSDMEDWTSAKEQTNTLTSIYAHSKGMVGVPAIAENTDGLDTSTLGWKPVSGLGEAIVNHLLTDTDDKIVSVRVEAYQGTVPCEYTGIAHNASIHPYISATPVESEEEYIETVASTFSFANLSNEPVYGVTSNLNFNLSPITSDTTISITSSDESVISAEGVVNPGLEAKHATVTATIASVSDPSISVSKSYKVTVIPNDGADNRYYWDFDNNGLSGNYNTAAFMGGHVLQATLENDPLNASNKVAAVENVTMSPDDYLTWVSFPSTAKYIAVRADMYLEKTGLASIVARDDPGQRIVIAQPNPSVTEQWQSLLTVLDIANPAASTRYRMNDGVWTAYENVSLSGYADFHEDLETIERFTIFGTHDDKVYVDNFSVKTYDDFYAEVNAATEANVIDVIEAFANMGIITLSDDYATADKAALAAAVKANAAYTSDSEVTFLINKFVSDDDIIIMDESISEGKLTRVKFILSDNVTATSGKLVIASYNSNDALVGISIANVDSLESDGYNVVTGLNLNVNGATKRKYMLWSDVSASITPLAKATEIN